MMTTPIDPNPTYQWAASFVDALVDAGLAAVCLAPGSRSTPLAFAFAAQEALPRFLHLDERSAGFFALGYAKAVGRPVALLCTSGTATANFLPAVVEARMSQVPLLVLTADRPPELRHSGANQTIDQLKLYGDQALWFVDVALPHSDAPPVALRNLRALAARALAVADGLQKGPVQLNFPFRKPFEPVPGESLSPNVDSKGRPRLAIERGELLPTAEQVNLLSDLIAGHERGLILCGPGCPGGEFPAAIAGLARQIGYPLLADPLSGVRFGPWLEGNAPVLGGYDGYLWPNGPDLSAPTLLLRFGALPTSSAVAGYLDRRPPTWHIHVRRSGVWADDSHHTNLFLQVDEEALCHRLSIRLPAHWPERQSSGWLQRFRQVEEAYWRVLQESGPPTLWDGAAVMDVLAAQPTDGLLFVGNSLPMRHVDQFGRPRGRPLHLFGNRGASGIDGNISTALGIAAARSAAAAGRELITILVGDITLLHDLTGLQAIRRHDLHAVVVVLHNDGGGIFHRLPARAFDPPFTELFITPHGLRFRPAAEMFGLEYIAVDSVPALRDALIRGRNQPESLLIEVRTSSPEDASIHRALTAQVNARLREQRL